MGMLLEEIIQGDGVDRFEAGIQAAVGSLKTVGDIPQSKATIDQGLTSLRVGALAWAEGPACQNVPESVLRMGIILTGLQ